MKQKKLINNKELHNFPFNYKYQVITLDNNCIIKNFKEGKISNIQNDNSKLETFYKLISTC